MTSLSNRSKLFWSPQILWMTVINRAKFYHFPAKDTKVIDGGGGRYSPPQVDSVLKRPGEIGLRALNFVSSKSYFIYSILWLFFMSTFFRHYPGMNLIDQSCTVQIYLYHQNNLQVSVLFVYDVHQTCHSNQIPLVECDNLIGPII